MDISLFNVSFNWHEQKARARPLKRRAHAVLASAAPLRASDGWYLTRRSFVHAEWLEAYGSRTAFHKGSFTHGLKPYGLNPKLMER